MTNANAVPILVSGATGKIEGTVVRQLLQRGQKVRALVHQNSRHPAFQPETIRERAAPPDALDAFFQLLLGVTRLSVNYGQSNVKFTLLGSNAPRDKKPSTLKPSTLRRRECALAGRPTVCPFFCHRYGTNRYGTTGERQKPTAEADSRSRHRPVDAVNSASLFGSRIKEDTAEGGICPGTVVDDAEEDMALDIPDEISAVDVGT